MPWERTGLLAAEYHAPGQVRDTPPELVVDEIAEAPGTQSERSQGSNKIGNREKSPSCPARKQPHGDNDAKQSPVEGHAAGPEVKHLKGMFEVIGKVVKKNIAEPPAENDTQHAVEN